MCLCVVLLVCDKCVCACVVGQYLGSYILGAAIVNKEGNLRKNIPSLPLKSYGFPDVPVVTFAPQIPGSVSVRARLWPDFGRTFHLNPTLVRNCVTYVLTFLLTGPYTQPCWLSDIDQLFWIHAADIMQL